MTCSGSIPVVSALKLLTGSGTTLWHLPNKPLHILFREGKPLNLLTNTIENIATKNSLWWHTSQIWPWAKWEWSDLCTESSVHHISAKSVPNFLRCLANKHTQTDRQIDLLPTSLVDWIQMYSVKLQNIHCFRGTVSQLDWIWVWIKSQYQPYISANPL